MLARSASIGSWNAASLRTVRVRRVSNPKLHAPNPNALPTPELQLTSGLSRAGEQVIARRSGHAVPLEEPDVIVAAIEEVLTLVRRRGDRLD